VCTAKEPPYHKLGNWRKRPILKLLSRAFIPPAVLPLALRMFVAVARPGGIVELGEDITQAASEVAAR
jgi:hypothetical protein